MRKLIAFAVVTFVSLPLLAADEPPRPGDDGTNVQFEISLTDVSGVGDTSERSIQALALDGTRIGLLTGWRIPIPTTTFNTANTAGSNIVPVTSYQYQETESSALAGFGSPGRSRSAPSIRPMPAPERICRR
jgi:hypothetical protein